LALTLAGGHQRLRKCHPHLTPHNLQQDPHSAVVIEMLEFPDEVGKWPSGYSDCLPFLKVEVELDVTFWIDSLNQALYHPIGNWLRLPAIGNQAVDPKGPIDPTPRSRPRSRMVKM
jgi:hypothetical protein